MGRTACTEPQCLYKGALYPILHFYMFRAYLGPSSGGTTNPTRTTDSHLKRTVSTKCCIDTVYLLMIGLDTPETCRGWRNILRISCASSWFSFRRSERYLAPAWNRTQNPSRSGHGLPTILSWSDTSKRKPVHCLVSFMKMTNKMQLCRLTYCSLTALYVSSDIFAHHQEHLNCIYSFRCYSHQPATTCVNNTKRCKYSSDAPDDERKYRSKHVEQSRNNKLSYTVASCWSFS
jgi:hypothetical protein